jgi:hypothetical protein
MSPECYLLGSCVRVAENVTRVMMFVYGVKHYSKPNKLEHLHNLKKLTVVFVPCNRCKYTNVHLCHCRQIVMSVICSRRPICVNRNN